MSLANVTKGEWVKGVAHWRDGDSAFISVAFTWRLPEARTIADYYRQTGCSIVKIGGPATFTEKAKRYIADIADVIGGTSPDAIARHNPMATRASYGCPVDCHFCIVSKMDGKAFSYLPDFPVRPVLCDDNLSALPAKYQEHIIKRYVASGVPLLDANSGFEPATFDEDVFARWKPILRGPWRFGFDEKTEGVAVARAFRILRDVSPRRKQVYTMIGHEPFAVCMERIQYVIANGGEPYAQPFMKLNALAKEPAVSHDWTAMRLKQVQRWVNGRYWKYTDFAGYNASAKSSRDNPQPQPQPEIRQ